jgi:hypothetical protein
MGRQPFEPPSRLRLPRPASSAVPSSSFASRRSSKWLDVGALSQTSRRHASRLFLIATTASVVASYTRASSEPARPVPSQDDLAVDRFGVAKLYPTTPGGREWYLPEQADAMDGEWGGARHVTATDEPGTWHLQGSPRVVVSSPTGKPWWRNVELTAYYRLHHLLNDSNLPPGFQFYARGERHTSRQVSGESVNSGRLAPRGTPTWPGYPFTGEVNGSCLASSYKGYVNIDGTTQIKKEISHTAGYTGGAARNLAFAGASIPMNQWLGFKTVIRNYDGDRSVEVEVWIDERADGTWKRTSYHRDAGCWPGTRAAGLDGCTKPPFSYTLDQVVTWAGPHVAFRFDRVAVDLKWLSTREIEALP